MASDSYWADLAAVSPSSDGFHRRRVAGSRDWALYAAIETPRQRFALLLEVPTRAIKSASRSFEQSRGLSIEVETMGKGASGRLRLILRLGAVEFQDVFLVFASTIVEQLKVASGAEAAVTGLFSQVVRWQRFLELFSSQGMSESAQLGLYGELTTLVALCESVGSQEAVAAWTGPSGSRQDFQFARTSVEVKATRGGPPHLFRATSVGQLDVSPDVALFLRHLVFERVRGNENTLPCLVATMRAAVATAPSAARELDSKLQDAGYIDAQARMYLEYGYIERAVSLFEVRADFPRLKASDLPIGIGDITYTIQLAAVERFRVEWPVLVKSLERSAARE